MYPGRVTLRAVSAEKLLAWAAAFVGAVGLVSALTPEMVDRVKVVQGVLPPGWPEVARVLTVAFGLGLLFLSRSLAKRRRRAWRLAVAVVVASAVAHLAKGLDFEEAAVSVLLLVALVRWRHRFDVPGDPASVRPLLGRIRREILLDNRVARRIPQAVQAIQDRLGCSLSRSSVRPYEAS